MFFVVGDWVSVVDKRQGGDKAASLRQSGAEPHGERQETRFLSGTANAAQARHIEKLIAILEEERGKIAREVHDEASQFLVFAVFRLDQAIANIPQQFAAREMLDQARQALNDCAEALHRLAFNLRPRLLDDLGLLPALRSYANRFAGLGSTELQVDLQAPPRKLSPATELAIFRIVQEAVANARKHSRADIVSVRLTFSNEYAELEIADDGIGFEPGNISRENTGRPKLGLCGMFQRATALGGELCVTSMPNSGAVIRARIPIEDVSNGQKE